MVDGNGISDRPARQWSEHQFRACQSGSESRTQLRVVYKAHPLNVQIQNIRTKQYRV